MSRGLDPNETMGEAMTVIGYARVSTTDQDLSIQEAALEGSRLRGDPRREAQRHHDARPRGAADGPRFLRAGDVLMVTRIDRLARSIGDLQDIVRAVKASGATLKATEQPIDTSTAAGKCFLDMLGVFAEFETNLRRERQLEGIAKAKARASTRAARRRSIPPGEAAQGDGLGPTEIARTLKIGRASVYRVLEQVEGAAPNASR